MSEQKQQIKNLIEKAAKSDKADDAMKFSQAALNAANALCSMAVTDTK